jgi:hypothetical protein
VWQAFLKKSPSEAGLDPSMIEVDRFYCTSEQISMIIVCLFVVAYDYRHHCPLAGLVRI